MIRFVKHYFSFWANIPEVITVLLFILLLTFPNYSHCYSIERRSAKADADPAFIMLRHMFKSVQVRNEGIFICTIKFFYTIFESFYFFRQ